MRFNYNRFKIGVGLGLCSSAAILAGCYSGASEDFPVFGDTAALEGDKVVTFNRADPSEIITSTPITGADGAILAFDFRPLNNLLYGVTKDKIYEINPETGVASDMGTLRTQAGTSVTIDSDKVDVDFDPVRDNLRVVTDTGQNLIIIPDSGITIVDPNLNGTVINGAVKGYHALAMANSHRGSCTTDLFAIDVASRKLLRQGGRNGTVVEIGPLGVAATEINGFDIVTAYGPKVDTAYANLTVGGVSKFYSINMLTGAATEVGTAAGSYRSMTNYVPEGYRPNEPGDIYTTDGVILEGGLRRQRINSFFHDFPNNVCTQLQTTSVANANDLNQAIMFHPNGTVYLLVLGTDATASQARLNKVDLETGVYTFVSFYQNSRIIGSQTENGGLGAKVDVNNPAQWLLTSAGIGVDGRRLNITQFADSTNLYTPSGTTGNISPKITITTPNDGKVWDVGAADFAFDKAGTTIYGVFTDFTPYATTGNYIANDQIGSIPASDFTTGAWTAVANGVGLRTIDTANVKGRGLNALVPYDELASKGDRLSLFTAASFDIDRNLVSGAPQMAYLLGNSLADVSRTSNAYLFSVDLATQIVTPVNGGDNRLGGFAAEIAVRPADWQPRK